MLRATPPEAEPLNLPENFITFSPHEVRVGDIIGSLYKANGYYPEDRVVRKYLVLKIVGQNAFCVAIYAHRPPEPGFARWIPLDELPVDMYIIEKNSET